jgi:hypothetical protein
MTDTRWVDGRGPPADLCQPPRPTTPPVRDNYMDIFGGLIIPSLPSWTIRRSTSGSRGSLLMRLIRILALARSL